MSAMLAAVNTMTACICTMLNLKRISDNQKVVDNRQYVPKEILAEADQNTTIQEGKPIITKEGNYQVTTHNCGCIFKTAIKGGFGFDNHWCDQHAPRRTFDTPNIHSTDIPPRREART